MADNESRFSEIVKSCGIDVDEAIHEFEHATLYGHRISELPDDEQRIAIGMTLRMLAKAQRENHELRMADIPRQIEEMLPKRGRFVRALDCLLEKK